MSLYERTGTNQNTQTDSNITVFVKETYKLFAASMLAGATGAYVGIPMASTIAPILLPLFFLEIGLLFALNYVKNKPGINLMVMFLFVFLTGITTAPLLSSVLSLSNGSSIVGNAFVMTSVVFASMSLFAIKTEKDFTGYTKPLFISMIVIIVFSLLNFLFFHNPMISIAISGVVVLLFSIMVIYDTQNIIKGHYETPIDGAIALYIDFLNIFTSLLHLFGIFGDDD
jgi:modulator of FtsH protease